MFYFSQVYFHRRDAEFGLIPLTHYHRWKTSYFFPRLLSPEGCRIRPLTSYPLPSLKGFLFFPRLFSPEGWEFDLLTLTHCHRRNVSCHIHQFEMFSISLNEFQLSLPHTIHTQTQRKNNLNYFILYNQRRQSWAILIKNFLRNTLTTQDGVHARTTRLTMIWKFTVKTKKTLTVKTEKTLTKRLKNNACNGISLSTRVTTPNVGNILIIHF